MSKLLGYRPEAPGSQPPLLCPDYGSTRKRAPSQRPIALPPSLSELTGPLFGAAVLKGGEEDLTAQGKAPPQGERIVVAGRLLDEAGRPVPDSLIEIWQANAAGRYRHDRDTHDAPLDPHFVGRGRCVSDAEGRYRFVTIRPGAYPWRNHDNAWRPAHIHLSLFGPAFATRLVTQMYFPGDPLFAFDPIFNAVPDPAARQRLVARFDLATTVPETALGYRFDIVLRGRDATPLEPAA